MYIRMYVHTCVHEYISGFPLGGKGSRGGASPPCKFVLVLIHILYANVMLILMF